MQVRSALRRRLPACLWCGLVLSSLLVLHSRVDCYTVLLLPRLAAGGVVWLSQCCNSQDCPLMVDNEKKIES